MPRMYYAEDRSAGKTGKDASPWTGNICDLFELTDWSADEMDRITTLDVGDEHTTRDTAVYVKRLT